jgi:hypothetical protein
MECEICDGEDIVFSIVLRDTSMFSSKIFRKEKRKPSFYLSP